MLPFMDYVAREFGHATNWNYDNSYSFLTATSDALLSFETPTSATLHVSSLSTANFATSYTLSALGQLDGSVSYLYSNIPLGHVPSRSRGIPLQNIVEGYRDVPLPVSLEQDTLTPNNLPNGRKPTLLHATLALPPPSTLTGLYSRRVSNETLLSVFLTSKSSANQVAHGPPPASVLAHVQHDTGRYSIEALGSTDSALLGLRGLWNFGLGTPDPSIPPTALSDLGGNPSLYLAPSSLNRTSARYRHLTSKPSLLSAGAEFYYSPFSHVIGLSTGLRFTTLGSHIKPGSTASSPSKPLAGTSAAFSTSLLAPPQITQSSFPYTMTLTLNPIIGSLASTYSVKPTANLALSSRFDFNVYSWESQYVVGAEMWRRPRTRPTATKTVLLDGTVVSEDRVAWARRELRGWFSDEEKRLKEERIEREGENVVKVKMDDGWNLGVLWSGRVKGLLVDAGVTVSPVAVGRGALVDAEGRRKRWAGKVGVSVAYST